MTRVIQDSDDESEDDALESGPDRPVDAPRVSDAFVEPKQLSLHTEHCTGSTESLKRAFTEAHRAHLPPSLQALPAATFQDDLNTPTPPQERMKKRRKLSLDGPVVDVIEVRPTTKRPAQMYGRSQTSISSPHLRQHQVQSPIPHDEGGRHCAWASDVYSGDRRVPHEPTTMFPEQSSTVPNATLTQQRLLGEVMAPAFLGLEDFGPNEPSFLPQVQQSSVPWSDYLKTQSEHVESQLGLEDSQEQSNETGQLLSSDQTQYAYSAGILDPTSQMPRRSHRSKHHSLNPLNSSSQREEVTIGESTSSLMNSPRQGEAAIELPGPTAPFRAGLQPSKKNHLSEHCETSQESYKRSTEMHGSPPPLRLEHQLSSPLRHNSDDIMESVDLPKEQYKPRPSRSRSSRIQTEPGIDFSVRPETAAAKRARRIKTIESLDDLNVASTPRQVKQLCDMGFTPNTTRKALEKNNNDVNQTVEWLVSNAPIDDHDELALPCLVRPTNEKGRTFIIPGKPNNETNKEIELLTDDASSLGKTSGEDEKTTLPDVEAERNESLTKFNPHANPIPRPNDVPELRSSPKVVILNTKRKRVASWPKSDEPVMQGCSTRDIDESAECTSKTPKGRKAKLGQHSSALQEYPVRPEPAKEKKRGRGRPRKVPIAPRASNIKQEDDAINVQSNQQGTDVPTTKVELNIDCAIELSSPGADVQANSGGPRPITDLPGSPAPAKDSAPVPDADTVERRQRPSLATQLFPVSTGKVVHRVGLSKRARIAPLLRVVKK